MIIFGQNRSLLQAIKMKLLALEQQKEKKDLKSVFHFSKHVFTSQAIAIEEGLYYLSAFKIRILDFIDDF
jgi:hypothetical protein